MHAGTQICTDIRVTPIPTYLMSYMSISHFIYTAPKSRPSHQVPDHSDNTFQTYD